MGYTTSQMPNIGTGVNANNTCLASSSPKDQLMMLNGNSSGGTYKTNNGTNSTGPYLTKNGTNSTGTNLVNNGTNSTESSLSSKTIIWECADICKKDDSYRECCGSVWRFLDDSNPIKIEFSKSNILKFPRVPG